MIIDVLHTIHAHPQACQMWDQKDPIRPTPLSDSRVRAVIARRIVAIFLHSTMMLGSSSHLGTGQRVFFCLNSAFYAYPFFISRTLFNPSRSSGRLRGPKGSINPSPRGTRFTFYYRGSDHDDSCTASTRAKINSSMQLTFSRILYGENEILFIEKEK